MNPTSAAKSDASPKPPPPCLNPHPTAQPTQSNRQPSQLSQNTKLRPNLTLPFFPLGSIFEKILKTNLTFQILLFKPLLKPVNLENMRNTNNSDGLMNCPMSIK